VSRLVARIRGQDRAGRMADTFLGPENPLRLASGTAEGIPIDGAVYQLDGQPPRAQSKGWGDLSWLYQRRGRPL
jgi:hypothetical protein